MEIRQINDIQERTLRCIHKEEHGTLDSLIEKIKNQRSMKEISHFTFLKTFSTELVTDYIIIIYYKLNPAIAEI